jgi:hypothetical protein
MRLVSKLWLVGSRRGHLCLVRRLAGDDLVVCLAWVFTIGVSSAIMYGSTVGLGKVDAAIASEWWTPL